MTSRIGEYGQARYIKHPTPSATAPFGNGVTIDAGTMIIMDSNASWLCRESVRQLVWCAGPGSVPVWSDSSKVYIGLADWNPGRTVGGTYAEIPWDRRTSARFGPVPVIMDEANSDGFAVGRVVHVQTDVNTTVGSLNLYWALTTSPSPELLYTGQYVAFARTTGVTTGQTPATLTPTVPIPGSMVGMWPCRTPSTTLTSMVYVVPMWIWFGWRPIDAGVGTCSIQSCSAWETR